MNKSTAYRRILLAFLVGWVLGYVVAARTVPPEKVLVPVKQASRAELMASILTCPVTINSIEEYYRTCRARARNEKIGRPQ